ncbi:MAG TPA: phosphopantetheine-binding protein, partial [Aliidiomarina sp.]|nr:phosphopantetheine-binding protein [Aliidiomarina sp.]
ELLKCMEEVAAQTGTELAADLAPHSTLVESGLDSLAMAMVIAKMDERLGSRPFSDASLEGMPGTLAELVLAYKRMDDIF